MSSVNEARILGHLGKDPECRYTNSGTAWCAFDVGTTESMKQQDGTWKSVTDWHRVVFWKKQAENCARFLKKGSKVYIEGSMKKRSYEKDGRKQFISEILGQKIIFLTERKNSGDGGQEPFARESEAPDSGGFDQDIPF
jgi:single-strand DNA-binding protein